MSAQTSEVEQQPRDVIFRNYSAQQASNYAEGRLGYSEKLIEFITSQHKSTGGKDEIVLDVGCGPGPATRLLAPRFDVAYGADPGESMIKKAQEIGGTSANGNPIMYTLSSAEEVDKIDGLGNSSVDLITAATAAHWFDMTKFWKAAAKLLKPGGTVAIWTAFRQSDTSGGNEIQAIIDDFRENVLGPYNSAGTQLTEDGYVDLIMPWDDSTTALLYDRQSSSRHELSVKDGYFPSTYLLHTEAHDIPLDEKLHKFEKLINSFGSVNRWQEANPELVGTEDDIVKVLMRKIRKAAENNGGSLDFSSLAGKFAIAVIIVKKS
ncbi:trans-aconitate 3-methyltransferase [Fusarium longipes]|uniref:Trans-aconitate 3-methyltransferase n=1 Tax=Fusarium longipes TaxID=694270 RepID=A0A395SR73_9HYPO|nr:trans-aconitate 3-methyltransferase [Fusarium longipes]